MPLALSQIILASIRRGRGSGELVTAFIGGMMGSGKTTYALKVAEEVYSGLGYADSWAATLEHTFMTPDSFKRWLGEALANYREHVKQGMMERYRKTPVIILDDLAGGWIDRYEWRESTVQVFAKIFNMVRSLTASVLLTSIEREDVVRSIRNKVSFMVTVKPVDDWWSIAKGYSFYMTPSGEERTRLVFEDYFTRGTLPKHVYQQLEEARLNALSELAEEINALLPEKGGGEGPAATIIAQIKRGLAKLGVETEDVVSGLYQAAALNLLPGAGYNSLGELVITRETLDALGVNAGLRMVAKTLGGRRTFKRGEEGQNAIAIPPPGENNGRRRE